jgi:hypothetical protein
LDMCQNQWKIMKLPIDGHIDDYIYVLPLQGENDPLKVKFSIWRNW